ncbi:MAG: class I SAM-dependent methyltransferase [Planctomycetota bacterium]
MSNTPAWLDQNTPHDDDRDAAQRAGLAQLFGRPGVSVLDLGCGTGRTLIPLVEAGAIVTGVDTDSAALETCTNALHAAGMSADLRELDFMAPWPALGGPFDAIMCLGNTWMTVLDIDDAIATLGQVRRGLRENGVFIIDDLAHDFFPELTEGNWQSGISEDGDLQMVWATAEPIFALRPRAAIDPDIWTPKATDQRFRLWTIDLLTAVARLAGFSDPQRRADDGLLVFSPA